MNATAIQTVDQAWHNLNLALGAYSASQTAANESAVANACDKLRSQLLDLCSAMTRANQQSIVSNLLPLMQAISDQQTRLSTAAASLKTSNNSPPATNYFGTFLSAMNLHDAVLAFRAELPKLRQQCTQICLQAAANASPAA
ncbi:MAG: hypothetical protein JSS86_13335 [Cyanobacteria bacterium SZAS LIN-2]|nr:hypothetical protein [Cyanobacteria bacterium SZAS LIN-3]MBS1997295.1 hypothetical protein [Cyanobacteria bacterium SZAS LIN-2]